VRRSAKYPPEFRREAVEIVRSPDRTILEMAHSLGVTDSTFQNWLKADREARARAADPKGFSESELAELARLRKENVELRVDREILWKAAAYFARETMP
jgi:transposase